MAYIGKSPDVTGVRARYYFTATGGETSLSGADDNAITLSFSDGAYVDVYLNGLLLVAGTDYNTTTANTISGLAALAANDIVEILVYDIFTVADTVSASAGGTFSANVAITGDLTVDTNTLHVDAANNRVGIGTVSPSQTVEISNDGNAGLDIVDSGSGDPAIRLSVANSAGYVGTTTNHSLRFIANDSEVGRFLSGGGLTFNGDTATANALDDYEEGSNTSANVRNSSGTLLTAGTDYTLGTNSYTKIGRMVFVAIRIRDLRGSKGDFHVDAPFTISASDRQYGVHFGGTGADSRIDNSSQAASTRVRLRGSGEYKYGFYSIFT